MSYLNQVDEKEILRSSRTGLWRGIFANTAEESRLYADALMDELLGVTENLTAQERYEFFAERIHPDDRELFQEYVDKLTETRTEIVYRYIHPVSGEMLVRCGGVRDMSVPNQVCILGTHQDISNMVRLEQDGFAERRLAEQNMTLRKEQVLQEGYYRDLLDIQNCGVLAYTLPGHKVTHMNKEALRMYDVRDIQEAQANLGTILSKVHYPDPKTIERLKKLRQVDNVVDYECIINYGQENACHAMAKTKAIRMPNGERTVVTTFLDVSDMITLRKALQQAQEGSRAKSSFLFAMSHDLRTPMNAIIGYADLMEAHWDEKELSWSYLQKLKDASRFLLALIGNVLEVSRIESGKETLHEAVWDLKKLSETLDVLLENEVERKGLDVVRNISISHSNVVCDVVKIREIFMNLLSNAVKYTPAGGRIEVTIKDLPTKFPDQIVLRIAVADNGIGIAKEYIPHLFEAFTRERDSAQSGIMGTGLGLRIVKSFVDLMNGRVQVESVPGEGSCFTVEIPLKLASEKEGEQTADAEEKKVLLAENGAEAVKMLQEAPAKYYDLILMDIQMPVMNGYQAARAIRKLPEPRSQTPIIAMTANAFEEDRQAAFEAGMDAYTAKPIEIAKLMKVIGETLGK